MSFEPVPAFNNNDVIDLNRLNAIVSNLNELNNNKVTMRFSTPELVATRNLKVAAGRIDLIPGRASETTFVDFEGFFESLVCKPVISATFASANKKRVFISISDVTQNGFYVTVETETGDPFTTGNSVHWTAYGL